MKLISKAFVLYLFVVFVCTNASAQKVQVSSTPTSGLLWEVSGKGLKEPSYFFGTYHLVGKSFLDTLPAVRRCFDKAKVVVGEVVMGDESAMMQALMPMMLLKDEKLQDILTPREFAEVELLVESIYKNKLTMYNALKPIAIQFMLMVDLAPKNITPLNPSLDMYFQSEAKAANKPIYGLETLDQQGELLFNGSMKRQKELLLLTVRERRRLINEMELMFKQYKEQDLRGLEKSFLESKDYTPEEMNDLLTKRNHNWMLKIPEMMKNGSVFFAIGAGHLVGDEGILALLRKQGYTLKSIALK